MNKSRHTKAFLISGLLFVILFAHLPVVYTLFYHNLTDAPTAQAGSMDGTRLSPSRSGVLDGSWQFYWNRLIVTEPQKNSKPDFLIQVPDYWSKYQIDGNWLPAGGFASYRLVLRGLEYSRPVTVFIPDFGGAYRAFIDGTLTAESGTVSREPGKLYTTPQTKLRPVTLFPGKKPRGGH